MRTDTIAVIVTVLLAVGAAYAGLARRIDRLGEQLSHIERFIRGWLNPLPPDVRDRQEKV